MSNNKGNRSDIFESFVKIALKEGLISEADEGAEHTEKDFPETNPRYDSLTIEQISKLYNTKTPRPKEMEYKKNIMEIAHPDSLVISPSYDKLNGLIENEIEGQNIRLHIVNKEPDGHLTQRKYAEKQLLLSLVRVGNDLDNRNENELRELADVCLAQASGKQFHKVAFWPLAIAIAAAVGLLYAKQHLKFHSDGFTADFQKAEGEINDLLKSNSNWGVGVSYTPAFLQTVNKLNEELGKLNSGVQTLLPILDRVETPKTRQELQIIAQHPQTKEAAQALESFKATVEEVYPFIQSAIEDFSNEGYKQRATAQKGFMSQMVDSTEILHGGGGLIADDFDDVKHALQTLWSDIENIVKGLQGAENEQAKAQQQLQNAGTATTKLFHPQATPEATPVVPTATPTAKPAGSALDSLLNPLADSLKGMGLGK